MHRLRTFVRAIVGEFAIIRNRGWPGLRFVDTMVMYTMKIDDDFYVLDFLQKRSKSGIATPQADLTVSAL